MCVEQGAFLRDREGFLMGTYIYNIHFNKSHTSDVNTKEKDEGGKGREGECVCEREKVT